MGNPYVTKEEGSIAALVPVYNCLHALRYTEEHTVKWETFVKLGVLNEQKMTVERDRYEQDRRDRCRARTLYPDLSGEAETYFRKVSDTVAFFAKKKRSRGRSRGSTVARTSTSHLKRVSDEKDLVRKHETALEDAQGIWDEMTAQEQLFFREPREDEIEATLHVPVMVRKSDYELTGSGESEKEILNRTFIGIVEDYLNVCEKPPTQDLGLLLDLREWLAKLRSND